jgi:primase-polymerase (primpol)-like protein
MKPLDEKKISLQIAKINKAAANLRLAAAIMEIPAIQELFGKMLSEKSCLENSKSGIAATAEKPSNKNTLKDASHAASVLENKRKSSGKCGKKSRE